MCETPNSSECNSSECNYNNFCQNDCQTENVMISVQGQPKTISMAKKNLRQDDKGNFHIMTEMEGNVQRLEFIESEQTIESTRERLRSELVDCVGIKETTWPAQDSELSVMKPNEFTENNLKIAAHNDVPSILKFITDAVRSEDISSENENLDLEMTNTCIEPVHKALIEVISGVDFSENPHSNISSDVFIDTKNTILGAEAAEAPERTNTNRNTSIAGATFERDLKADAIEKFVEIQYSGNNNSNANNTEPETTNIASTISQFATEADNDGSELHEKTYKKYVTYYCTNLNQLCDSKGDDLIDSTSIPTVENSDDSEEESRSSTPIGYEFLYNNPL